MGKKAMKKKKVSIIARGRMAKVLVLKGARQHTSGGLKAKDIMKNKHGRAVSKKLHARGVKSPWMIAVKAARKAWASLVFAHAAAKRRKARLCMPRPKPW